MIQNIFKLYILISLLLLSLMGCSLLGSDSKSLKIYLIENVWVELNSNDSPNIANEYNFKSDFTYSRVVIKYDSVLNVVGYSYLEEGIFEIKSDEIWLKDLLIYTSPIGNAGYEFISIEELKNNKPYEGIKSIGPITPIFNDDKSELTLDFKGTCVPELAECYSIQLRKKQ